MHKCGRPPLVFKSSAPLGDDYELNVALPAVAHTSAINPTELNTVLRTLKAGSVSPRSAKYAKEALEPIAADFANASMAAACEQEAALTEKEGQKGYAAFDGGWDASRSGDCCTGTWISGRTGMMCGLGHARLSEAGATSSQCLEKRAGCPCRSSRR